jgi:hypothetical protein
LPGQPLDRAFMVTGYVFCLSTVFVLSKSVRDACDRLSTHARAGIFITKFDE